MYTDTEACKRLPWQAHVPHRSARVGHPPSDLNFTKQNNGATTKMEIHTSVKLKKEKLAPVGVSLQTGEKLPGI